MRVVKAAAVQLSPVLYSREGTVEKVGWKLHELHQQGVQFATFRETVVPYYPYFSFVQIPLQNVIGPEQRKLVDQAVTVPSLAADAASYARSQSSSTSALMEYTCPTNRWRASSLHTGVRQLSWLPRISTRGSRLCSRRPLNDRRKVAGHAWSFAN